MPQLDITILFPQLFWLIFFFCLFYIFLTFLFLPKFLVALKLRRNASEENLSLTNSSLHDLNGGIELANQKLHHNLNQLIKNFDTLKVTYQTNTAFNQVSLDTKVSKLVLNLLVFSDSSTLKSIKLNVKGFRSN